MGIVHTNLVHVKSDDDDDKSPEMIPDEMHSDNLHDRYLSPTDESIDEKVKKAHNLKFEFSASKFD